METADATLLTNKQTDLTYSMPSREKCCKMMKPQIFTLSEFFVFVFILRMWSHTSIVQDVQGVQAGLESASASIKEKKRTSCAT